MFACATLALICLPFYFVNLGFRALFGLKRQINVESLDVIFSPVLVYFDVGI
jgi:hypothetical protein